ncbi:MAG TPA: hypothetical protein IAC03_09120 [Candidatus Coprenecus pullistercoris]|nr:hypothetical protein [Candidatus Coprenecus pullistercoris]
MKHIQNLIRPCAALMLLLAVFSCRPDKEADFNLAAAHLDGEYNGPIGNDGECNYYIHLSDKGFDAEGNSCPGGTYYRFDIFSHEPADTSDITVPTGRYTLGTRGSTASGTFTQDRSMYFVNGTSGSSGIQLIFSQGVLDISCNDGTYTLEAELTDVAGMTHRVRYTGDMKILDHSSGTGTNFLPLDRDLYIYSDHMAATDYGQVEGRDIHNIVLSMTDMPSDKDGNIVTPGHIISMDCYVTFTEDGLIKAGNYEISQYWGTQDFTLSPGEIVNDQFVGTIAAFYDNGYKAYLGLLSSGTLSISHDNSADTVAYDLEFEFRTQDGYMVTGSYSGAIDIVNAGTVPEAELYSRASLSRPVSNPMARTHFTLSH